MLKKLINRSEGSQVEMTDSVLRDIIPSNDLDIKKDPKQKRFSTICKILIVVIILGLVAIGIVAFGLFLAFSGKYFMNYIIHSTGNISNKTHVQTVFHQETTVLDEQNLNKITVMPIDNNQQVHIPMRKSIMSDEQLTLTTEENQITTDDTFTSTIFISKIRDREKIPLTTEIVLQTSTNENKKEMVLIKHKNLEEDDIINDLLYQ